MAQTITTEMIRIAFRAFAKGEQKVSNHQLYDALGITLETEKQRMRTRVTDMVNHGEVVRVGSGLYTYNFKYRLRNAGVAAGYSKMWRFVRQQKDGWSLKDCALLTGLTVSHIQRYMNFLEEEGYIAVIGVGKRKERLFRCLKKGKDTPEAPAAFYADKDPFEKERVAGAKIVRTLLCGNLSSQKASQDICEACQLLLRRFDSSNAQSEEKNVQHIEEGHYVQR